MKATIHPQTYPEAKITCACGNTFVMGLTVPTLAVEVCSNCHPFYTGKMKYVDIAGRVDTFKARQAGAVKRVLSKAEKRKAKKQKRIDSERGRPTSLAELRRNKKR
ncbi:MAG: hypothetical protein ACD_52C00056G0002 [uncultured bacterium]|uniref:50S ribosomal protein L31 n=1 Tax=Candidatus Woesebacteria bacterium RIFCSPHIGHO2_12_FULL_41_24 TaxID=1802510 RepID=A0A1F8ASH5_9BACT|nr:MAG: hypothetical protein ACD_52C00056G0002 [uncultured bacterium]OGM13419.1 MAG: 50S ribosomal protein L31 [Candidatus Woesebacteria bacterium RBG_16_41_13]OGM30479.1 MAG: 50S ribosomal protein L31 [Candidatus Woesebacteria bacterium RIFCSPHIGHO2_01_FULL_42_80]OGM35963.1 MAG: 50S ribosomal protein L31 [Candidatus Woesebacteria bacterium RIFCSPHIGHO2_02_FULL_42_20]OGM54145.1 MAG: 50S ribosomal protein L31 [Candidatus Woesebacteria bacterium RIFCSPHIGHO2_12_FULL_41_24]OGM66481.1 MAG: 50S rib